MRHRLVYCLLAAIAGSPVAYADITIDFSTPVNTVSFYSSEPDNLTANTNGSSPLHLTVNSGYTLGAVTLFADTNVTAVDFSGTPDEYVLDDFTYSVGSNTYVLNFDDPALVQGDSVGSFYAGWAGGPTFSPDAIILTAPDYNVSGFPYESSPSVIDEGTPGPSPTATPEPGSFLLLGSGLVGLAGVVRRKIGLSA